MRTVIAAVRSLVGLFVDDGGFAATILAWLAVGAAGSLLAGIPPTWRGPVLLIGLVVILSRACLRSARRRI